MEYHGKLYGKIGNKYFETGKTSKDFDKMVTVLKDCKTHFEAIENLGLQNNIPDWLSDNLNKILTKIT